MPRPYNTVDLRERVVRLVDERLSCRETGSRLHVSISFVIMLVQWWRRRETVDLWPLAATRHRCFRRMPSGFESWWQLNRR